MWSIYVTIFFVSLSTNFVKGQEGSLCNISKHKTGICILLPQCPQAVADIKKGISPSICAFKGKIPIVCCDNHLTTTAENIKSMRINEQKCTEYGESVYSWKIPPILTNTNNNEKVKVNQCFQPNLLLRGDGILPREYPHLALIGNREDEKYSWLCLGSLISERFVLTAAHCLNTFRGGPEVNSVRLGAIDITSNSTENTQDFSIVQLIRHPDFKPSRVYHDIGLIQLDKDVKFTAFVRPACLQNEFEIPGQRTIAHNFDALNNQVITYSIMKLVDVSTCNKSYVTSSSRRLNQGVLPETQICASLQHKYDVCQVVSGSPLEMNHNDVYCMFKIIAINSYEFCGNDIPGLYTRVSNYVPWIENVVWPTS